MRSTGDEHPCLTTRQVEDRNVAVLIALPLDDGEEDSLTTREDLRPPMIEFALRLGVYCIA